MLLNQFRLSLNHNLFATYDIDALGKGGGRSGVAYELATGVEDGHGAVLCRWGCAGKVADACLHIIHVGEAEFVAIGSAGWKFVLVQHACTAGTVTDTKLGIVEVGINPVGGIHIPLMQRFNQSRF